MMVPRRWCSINKPRLLGRLYWHGTGTLPAHDGQVMLIIEMKEMVVVVVVVPTLFG